MDQTLKNQQLLTTVYLNMQLVEQLQQLEEDSRLTTLPKPCIFIKIRRLAKLWHASNYIKRITILN